MCAASASPSPEGREEKDFWFEFENLPRTHLGYHVGGWTDHRFCSPNVEPLGEAIEAFFANAGLPAAKATGKGVGSATIGMVLLPVLPKLVGPTIWLVRFISAWIDRGAQLERLRHLPDVTVILLADHLSERRPSKGGPDSARMMAALMPELQLWLRERFPALRLRFKVRARTPRVPRVELRFEGLPISSRDVIRLHKLVDTDAGSLTLMHTRGWFALPTVRQARYVDPRVVRHWEKAGGVLP
ncbi:hypothetical protein [Sinomonas sp. B1-1]|uniref:hypothetical protein n=1 Tax=Sinomonas sp. B1-1 TaxID=3141454 RepID=UPI003D27B484